MSLPQEYFLNYRGERVFTILLGGSKERVYLYYPKADVVFVVEGGEPKLMEIVEVIGSAPAGLKLAPPSETWEKVRTREVTWYVLGREIKADNIYLVLESDSQFRKVEETSSPNRLKYYVLKDQDPWEFRDWCCVLIASTKDRDVPPSFKKVRIGELI